MQANKDINFVPFKYLVKKDTSNGINYIIFQRNGLSQGDFSQADGGLEYSESTCHEGLWVYFRIRVKTPSFSDIFTENCDSKLSLRGSPKRFSIQAKIDVSTFPNTVLTSVSRNAEYSFRLLGTLPTKNIAVLPKEIVKDYMEQGAELKEGPIFYSIIHKGVVRGEAESDVVENIRKEESEKEAKKRLLKKKRLLLVIRRKF